MKRKFFLERANMQKRLEDIGFMYWNLPSSDQSPYWSDKVAYEFTLKQIEQIEDAAFELHQMSMQFVEDEIRKGDYLNYGFTDLQKRLIEQSWQRKDPHLYGRFDFAYRPDLPPDCQLKMYEYNADTPTSILESSVAQWHWVQEVMNVPHRDQFNFLEEALVERFKQIKAHYNCNSIHLAGMSEAGDEDWNNVGYLSELAHAAGFQNSEIAVESIGVSTDSPYLLDRDNQNIELMFKLYPLEWMTQDHFAAHLETTQTRLVEPAWKLLLSNKLLCAKLWERHPKHPLLLESFPYTGQELSENYIRKPLLGREGANVFVNNQAAKGSEHSSFYDGEYLVQEKFDLPNFDNMYPVIGVWISGDKGEPPCGMAIREDYTPVTGNDSHFVPHYFIE